MSGADGEESADHTHQAGLDSNERRERQGPADERAGGDATQWNFAYLPALRYTPDRHFFFEFSVRHWSNARLKLPNRAHDLLLMSIGFR
ncbi:MAG: acyloxyacyl hydrolase [Pseudomonadota bacterium]|nr:acyloxyacyl hydrolase [Pseudomonadota bacterium]